MCIDLDNIPALREIVGRILKIRSAGGRFKIYPDGVVLSMNGEKIIDLELI